MWHALSGNKGLVLQCDDGRIVDFVRVRPLLEIDSVGFAQRTFLAYLADTYRSVFITLALSLSMD